LIAASSLAWAPRPCFSTSRRARDSSVSIRSWIPTLSKERGRFRNRPSHAMTGNEWVPRRQTEAACGATLEGDEL
jgi:hypothetical protein